MDWVYVGGLGVSVAGVLLSLEASVFGILELNYKSLWPPICSFFHIDKHPSAAVGQPIQGVNVVDKHYLTPHLQLQHSLERGILDGACTVDVELLNKPAGILGFDGEELSIYFIKLCIVSGVHFCVCSINVEGVGVNGEFV